MPCMGPEPTITEFERAKTIHALHRAATVIGGTGVTRLKLKISAVKTAIGVCGRANLEASAFSVPWTKLREILRRY
jgi:hypothetical protein